MNSIVPIVSSAKTNSRCVRARILLSLLMLVVVWAASFLGAFDRVDAALFEWRQEKSPRVPGGAIVLVDIDAKSLSELGRWPWPRSDHAELLNRLLAGGARQVVFDVDFSAPTIEVEDAAFQSALIGSTGRAAIAQYVTEHAGVAASDGSDRTVRAPIDRFADHAWVVAIDRAAERDQPLRFSTSVVLDGVTVPTVAGFIAGATEYASSRIDFSIDPFALPRVSYADVVQGRVDPSLFENRTVIVGATAAQLRRDVAVPVHGTLSDTERRVLAAETLLQGRTSTEVPLAVLVVLSLAMGTLFVVLNVGRAHGILIVLTGSALCVGIEAAGFRLLTSSAIVLPSATILVQLAVETVASLFVQVARARAQRAATYTDASNMQAMFDRVVEDNVAGVIVMDSNGHVIRINRVASELADVERGSLGERPSLDAIFPSMIAEPILAALESNDWTDASVRTGLFEFQDENGQTRFVEHSLTPISFEDPITRRASLLIAMTFSDVTSREGERRELAFHAEHDVMTGLRNRFAFMRLMENRSGNDPEGDRAEAAFLFDIDRFRFHNDINGTDAGDDIIRTVAARVCECLQEGDFFARLGGDQFVLVASRSQWSDIEQLAECVLATIRRPMRRGAISLDVTVSIGMRVIDGDLSAGALLADLDLALNQAKTQGGDRALRFAPRLAEEKIRLRHLETALPVAIARRQLTLAYQPQIDIGSGRVTGAEALARWVDPDHGFVSPMEFIALAERTGDILALGEFVLEEACLAACEWPSDMTVAVNLSVRQIELGDVVATVRDVLWRTGLPADRLELEVTESVTSEGVEGYREALRGLRRLGVRLALDDFGTGYASLAQLHDGVFDKIKLDRSFVLKLASGAAARTLFASLAQLIDDLGMDALVEGVEDTHQLDVVAATACRFVQGYHFSRPLPKRDVLAFVTAFNARKEPNELGERTA